MLINKQLRKKTRRKFKVEEKKAMFVEQLSTSDKRT
jgi:hypothetical protein